MRRSAGRRSSNILPIRPLSFAGNTGSSSTKSNSQQSASSHSRYLRLFRTLLFLLFNISIYYHRDGQKRSSSIPRPSISLGSVTLFFQLYSPIICLDCLNLYNPCVYSWIICVLIFNQRLCLSSHRLNLELAELKIQVFPLEQPHQVTWYFP